MALPKFKNCGTRDFKFLKPMYKLICLIFLSTQFVCKVARSREEDFQMNNAFSLYDPYDQTVSHAAVKSLKNCQLGKNPQSNQSTLSQDTGTHDPMGVMKSTISVELSLVIITIYMYLVYLFYAQE